jgi:hypothetical protein
MLQPYQTSMIEPRHISYAKPNYSDDGQQHTLSNKKDNYFGMETD